MERLRRCVFLTEDDRCSIHPVAPFGCARFNVCDGPETRQEADRRVSACLQAIVDDKDYLFMWFYLHNTGKVARPVAERRGALLRACGRRLDDVES